MNRRTFIRTTGSAVLLTASSGSIISCSASKQPWNKEELLTNALTAFNRFEEVWDFNDFWKRGNTFDACLTFVDALRNEWPDYPEVQKIQQTVKTMLEENLAFFNRFDPGSLWADDFGWWGLMALNARRHLIDIGEEEMADEYLKLSTNLCWE